MTLNELLKVVDDNTRIQIRLKMFGSTFSTNRYKNYLLNDEKEAKLLLCILFLLITLQENGKLALLKLQTLREPGLFQVHTVMTHLH